MEVILTKWSRNDWCLVAVCGNNPTLEHLTKVMESAEEQYPDAELRFETVKKNDCWWNDPTMVR